jgi:hypothetical protein
MLSDHIYGDLKTTISRNKYIFYYNKKQKTIKKTSKQTKTMQKKQYKNHK